MHTRILRMHIHRHMHKNTYRQTSIHSDNGLTRTQQDVCMQVSCTCARMHVRMYACVHACMNASALKEGVSSGKARRRLRGARTWAEQQQLTEVSHATEQVSHEMLTQRSTHLGGAAAAAATGVGCCSGGGGGGGGAELWHGSGGGGGGSVEEEVGRGAAALSPCFDAAPAMRVRVRVYRCRYIDTSVTFGPAHPMRGRP